FSSTSGSNGCRTCPMGHAADPGKKLNIFTAYSSRYIRFIHVAPPFLSSSHCQYRITVFNERFFAVTSPLHMPLCLVWMLHTATPCLYPCCAPCCASWICT